MSVKMSVGCSNFSKLVLKLVLLVLAINFFISSGSKGSCVLWATMGTSLLKKGMLSKLLMLDFSNPFQMILIHTPLHSLHQYHQFSPEAIWGPGPNSREKSWLERCPGETPKWAWPGPFWGIKHDNGRVPGQGPENSEGPRGRSNGGHSPPIVGTFTVVLNMSEPFPNANTPCSKTVQRSCVQASVQGCLPIGIGHTCTSSIPAGRAWWCFPQPRSSGVHQQPSPSPGIPPAWGSSRSFCKSPLHHSLRRCAGQWNQCHSCRPGVAWEVTVVQSKL